MSEDNKVTIQQRVRSITHRGDVYIRRDDIVILFLKVLNNLPIGLGQDIMREVVVELEKITE